jgi:putative oxidoreductase
VYPYPGFWGFDYAALSLTLSLRPSLQRLFSMFPNDWPGKGLLLLRLGVGIVLTHDGVAEMLTASEWHGIIWQSLATIGGVLLLVGFFTPIAGVLVVIVELWKALSRADNLRTCIVLAVVGAALAMLGPGVWSLDARLFGRKRIDIGDR